MHVMSLSMGGISDSQNFGGKVRSEKIFPVAWRRSLDSTRCHFYVLARRCCASSISAGLDLFGSGEILESRVFRTCRRPRRRRGRRLRANSSDRSNSSRSVVARFRERWRTLSPPRSCAVVSLQCHRSRRQPRHQPNKQYQAYQEQVSKYLQQQTYQQLT